MIGIVLPRDIAAGDRFRASVVTDLKSYASVPGLRVLEVVAPLADGPSGKPTLDGLLVECGAGGPQPASQPLACSVPDGAGEAAFALSREAGAVPVVRAAAPALPRRGSALALFSAPPICVAGAVQIVEGPFGAAPDARLEVGGRAATVIATSPRALYWGLPAGTPVGENRILVRAGARSASMPVWVVRLALSADRLSLDRGETTTFHAVLSGLDSMPEAVWRGGSAPGLVDAERIADLAPGLGDGGARPGVILLNIENGSREAISLERATDERIVVRVSRNDVENGVFRYDGVIRSRRAGSFAISAAVLPLLRALTGVELPDAGAAPEIAPGSSHRP